ncbi:MAG: VOC family protein [Anaerolineae bacterium]|nr:VOC family protein [Anaerolineae bacterium]
MSIKLVINLPVKDLARSTRFFATLGFSFDQRIANENMNALIINDDSHVLLVNKPYFKSITEKAKKDIANATTTEVILQLRVESRQQVDALVDQALASGGQPASDPNDQGFLYGRSFQDLDDHLWDVFYMNPDAS